MEEDLRLADAIRIPHTSRFPCTENSISGIQEFGTIIGKASALDHFQPEKIDHLKAKINICK